MVMANLDATYTRWLDRSGDAIAASVLTLCETLVTSRERPEGAPLTVQDAAKFLGINRVTAYKLVNSGKLPSYRIGEGRGTIRIQPSDLQAFQQEAHSAGESVRSHSREITIADLKAHR